MTQLKDDIELGAEIVKTGILITNAPLDTIDGVIGFAENPNSVTALAMLPFIPSSLKLTTDAAKHAEELADAFRISSGRFAGNTLDEVVALAKQGNEKALEYLRKKAVSTTALTLHKLPEWQAFDVADSHEKPPFSRSYPDYVVL